MSGPACPAGRAGEFPFQIWRPAMTDTATRLAEARGSLPAHPLDPARPEEYLAGREILAAAGLLGHAVRFAYYGLEEPPKDAVLGGPHGGSGAAPDRRLRAFLIDVVTGESADVVLSVTQRKVISSRTLDPLADGQVPILDQDFALAEEIVHADPGWRAAMARRVFKMIDELDLPVPRESGDDDDPAVRGPLRTTLRPIEITQPEGPSFTLDGHLLEWQGWSLRIGFDAREGLTLHQVTLADDGGEYLVGKWANSLELGCDCLGEIAYLDATVTGDDGEPRTIGNAICIHEEDSGILWKHTDIFNGSAQSRRQRRLVISFFSTVGNYDY